MKRSSIFYIVLIALVGGVVGAAAVAVFSGKKEIKYIVQAPTGSQYKSVSYGGQDGGGSSFTPAAEMGVKAVVHVKTITKRSQEDSQNSFLEYFFGYRQYRDPGPQLGSGSGVIISPDGYIVTANHVIDGATEVQVVMEDNREFTSKVIGTDEATDIAVLKIDANELPFLRFGPSDSLRLGEWVLAIGNPFNLTSTVTAGIVSAKGRNNITPVYDRNSANSRIESFIQTDAAVNRGNSGGALVNLNGELVGINTSIYTPSGAFAGYSFAVPSSIVEKVVKDLMEFGNVRRAVLGITMQAITSDLAKDYGLKEMNGVYIENVVPGGAADQAGIKRGDVLTHINNTPVKTMSAVQEMINKYRPDDKVEVTVIRDGKTKQFTATLRIRDDKAIAALNNDNIEKALGATFKDVSPEVKRKLGVRQGVQITNLKDGAFKAAGVKEGFIITSVNRMPVSSKEELVSALQDWENGALLQGVYPDGNRVLYGIGK